MHKLLLLFSFMPFFCNAQFNCENIIILTIDGVRWQEVFKGADKLLLNKSSTNPIAQALFYDTNVGNNRKQLMPFFWNYIAKQGQLYGNKEIGNKMQVKNRVMLSYAGYNEIFTGSADNTILTNKKKLNSNTNFFELFINNDTLHRDAVSFTSWDLFPYIFNKERNCLKVNSGYNISDTSLENKTSAESNMVNNTNKTRYDALTYIAAKEYLAKNKPSLMHIGFGEADEFAHEKDYANYLLNINAVDKMIADLWMTIETHQHYKGKTIMLITTDHGRGNKSRNWHKHGMLTKGSKDTWMATLGNCILPKGEINTTTTIKATQIAPTIMQFLLPNYRFNNFKDVSFCDILLDGM